ncbi:MAG TPA: hypothetical protein VG672_19445 [Bryobacteraceae bacterium]|nr:hypothetical protein [Bryobacteraceae bacterium]
MEHLGGFPAAIFLQKLGGLATAALGCAAWMQLKRVMRYRLPGIVLHDLLGLLVLSHLLLDHGTMRYFEQAIMLEATSSCCLAAVIFAASRFLVLVRERAPAGSVTLWAALLIGSSLFTYAWNPRFGPCVPIAFLLAAAGFRSLRLPVVRVLPAFLVPVLLAAIFLFFPQYRISRANEWNRAFIPKHLFYMHARLVLPELMRDRDDPGFTRYPHDLLAGISGLIGEELARADREGPGWNVTLRFMPNRLLWGPADEFLHHYFVSNPAAYREFCLYYFKRAVWPHPSGYVQKVAREWIQLFTPGTTIMDPGIPPLSLSKAITDGLCLPGARDMVPKAVSAVRPAFQALVTQFENHAAFDDVVLDSPGFIRWTSGWVDDFFSYGVLVAAAFCLLLGWRKFRAPGLVNLGLTFGWSALLLASLIAPITLVMTVCGERHIQGLRVLFVFCAATIALMTVLLLAQFAGCRRLFLHDAAESPPQ